MFGMMGGRSPFMPSINPMINMGMGGGGAPQKKQPEGITGLFYGLMQKLATDLGKQTSFGLDGLSDEEKLAGLYGMQKSLKTTPDEGTPNWFADAMQSGLKQGMMSKYADLRESGINPYVDVNNKFGLSEEFINQEKKRRQQLMDSSMSYKPSA